MLLRARLGPVRNFARSKRPLPRILRWIFGLLIGLEVVYVVAANLLLEFGGVQALFGSTESVQVDFSRAWSVLPGRIHVQNVKVVIADHNIQCLVALDRVALTLRLLELPGRVFHVTKLRGSGLSLHFRNRVQPEDAKRPYVSALPPVPGFGDPPLYAAYVPTPPLSDEDYNLWTVHIEDVDVHIKELWAQQFRYLGHARARGAFRLKPARSLWVGPATLDLDPGRLLAGPDTTFLDDFGGRIACTVHRFDVRVPKGREVLRNISADIDLQGKVAGTGVFDLFTDPAAEVHVDQQGATLAVHVSVDHGAAKPKSHIDVHGDALTVHEKAIVFDANAPFTIVAAADEEGPGSHVDVSVAAATLGSRSSSAGSREEPPAPLRFERTTFTLRTSSRDTAGEWGVRGVSAVLGRLAASELRTVNDLSPALPVRFTKGSGEASGRVAYEGSVLTADGNASLDDVVARAAGKELRGTLNLRSTVDRFDVDEETYALRADVHAKDVGVADERGRASCPWGRAGAVKIGVELARAADALPTGKLDGVVEGAIAKVGGSTLSADLVVHTETEETAENRTVLRTAVRAKTLKFGGGEGKKRWGVEGKQALLQTELDWGGPIAGPVRLFLRGARAEMGTTKLIGDAVVDLRVASVDRKTQSGEVSGAIRVRDADIATGDRHVEKWWGTLNIERTRLALKDGLDVDGAMTTSMKDGVPLLFALSARDQIPEWLPTMLPLNGLNGDLTVHSGCRIFDVIVRELAGGPIHATGRVTSYPDEVRGAILVRGRTTGVFSAGIGIGEKSGGLSLFAGDDWLKGHLAWLRDATSAIGATACQKPPPPKQDSCER